MDYGFIVLRNVNSEKTNRYWNQCVKLIRIHYPHKKIVIIDDNSDYKFVNADFNYSNIEVIKSDYPARGELLPYIYYYKHRWFPKAVIIHDSVFIHKRYPFERIKLPILPLWHFEYDKENLHNILKLVNTISNNHYIGKRVIGERHHTMGFNNSNKFLGCFGVQCFIDLKFLINLENKYNISRLVNTVKTKKDRCSLERLSGAIFTQEFNALNKYKSLFGNIHKHFRAFSYNYDAYEDDFKNKRIKEAFVKVWTGR